VKRTTPRAAIAALTLVLVAAAAGCSSHHSNAGAQPSTAASTELTNAPVSAGPTSSAPESSAPATPADLISGSPAVTSAPPVTSRPGSADPPTPAPTAATTVPPRGSHAVTVVAGLACPDPGLLGQATSPSPKPLPASLAIKAVVRCETVQRSYPGLGNWSVQLAEVADAGLGPFLADLRAPADPMPSGIICPDVRILVPWFELVDSAGTAINVAIPTDQCGAPKTGAITALAALHFRVTDAVRLAPSG
jgi:hypothetical protein